MNALETDAIRERYEARDYSTVVRGLDRYSSDELFADPYVAFMLADSCRRVGQVQRSLELTNQVVDIARRRESWDALCDALNLHGVLLLEGGHAQAAERAWCELVIVASQIDKSQYVARASNNLGVTAILSMRLEEAIASFQRSVAAYLRLGYSRGLSQSHLNLGIVWRELDHEDESHGHFQRALTWAYAADSMDEVGHAEQELALLQIYLSHDIEGAYGNAHLSLQRFTELGEPAGTAEALKVIGIVSLARKHSDAAEQTLQSALRVSRDRQLRVLEGETLLALAVAARQLGNSGQAINYEQQARIIFAEMNASPWADQVARRMSAL